MTEHQSQALVVWLEPLLEPAWWIALGLIVAASVVVAGALQRSCDTDRALLISMAVGVAIWLLLTPAVGVAAHTLLADG